MVELASVTSKRFAYPKQNRLLNKAAFDVVFSDAKSSFCRYFTVLYKPNNLDNTRMGIICGRKISKKAVVRNRLKRVIRESYRQSSLVQKGPIHIDYIVLPKVNAVQVENEVLFQTLEKHWQRVHSRLLKLQAEGKIGGKISDKSSDQQQTKDGSQLSYEAAVQ